MACGPRRWDWDSLHSLWPPTLGLGLSAWPVVPGTGVGTASKYLCWQFEVQCEITYFLLQSGWRLGIGARACVFFHYLPWLIPDPASSNLSASTSLSAEITSVHQVSIRFTHPIYTVYVFCRQSKHSTPQPRSWPGSERRGWGGGVCVVGGNKEVSSRIGGGS